MSVYSLHNSQARDWTRSLIGGKAYGLAQVIGADLPVPCGFVIPAACLSASNAKGPGKHIWEKIRATVEPIVPPWIVRSSAAWEDSTNVAAPGVLESQRDITDICALEAAITAVASSWDEAHVRKYYPHAQAGQIAVIVQQQIQGTRGTVYTRPPGAPTGDTMIVETVQTTANNNAITTILGRDGSCDQNSVNLLIPPNTLEEIARLAVAAERAIGATVGADVEWVWDGNTIWIVQARPIVHPQPSAHFRKPPTKAFAFSQANPTVTWHWDATHNPGPLSPAQIGLVEYMQAANAAPYQMRVVCGYLYTSAPTLPPSFADTEDLQTLFTQQIHPAIEDALSPLEDHVPATIQQSVTAYRKVFSIYTRQLGPRLHMTRNKLLAILQEGNVDAHQAMELLGDLICRSTLLTRWLKQVARNKRSFTELLIALGPLAPEWDVSAPTYAETPERLKQAVEHYRQISDPDDRNLDPYAVREQLPPTSHPAFDRAFAHAKIAQEIAELDDLLFARAQAGVRRSLLSIADSWGLNRSEDIFYLPLPEVMTHTSSAPPTKKWIEQQVRLARRQRIRQRALNMPLTFAKGKFAEKNITSPFQLRGRGVSRGQVVGTIVRIPSDGTTPHLPQNAIVVAQTITPATILTSNAVGLVVEFGGILNHGAALARELHIPSVVGCRGAWHLLRDGERALVDAETGTVTLLRH